MKGMDSAYAVFKDLNHVDNNLALKYATYLTINTTRDIGTYFRYTLLIWKVPLDYLSKRYRSSGKEGKGMLERASTALSAFGLELL